MSTIAFEYPAVLTNKDWQKKKGLLAKGKPTGIGEMLTLLEKAFDGTAFGRIDPAKMAAETLDPAQFGQRRDALLRTLAHQGAKVDDAASSAADAVKAAAPLFANDKTVGKYLQTLAIALKGFRADLRVEGAYVKEVIAALDSAFSAQLAGHKDIKTFIKTAASLEEAMSDIKTKLAAVVKEQTIDATVLQFGNTECVSTIVECAEAWDRVVRVKLPELAKQFYSGSARSDLLSLPWLGHFGVEPESELATREMRKLVDAGQSESSVVLSTVLSFGRSVQKVRPFVEANKALATALKRAM